MLDSNMKSQFKVYLEKIIQPVELKATLDESEKSAEINALLLYLLAVTLPWFNESVTLAKFMGVVFILLGIWIISRPEVK